MENVSISKQRKNILIRVIFPIIRNEISLIISFTGIEQLFTTQIRWDPDSPIADLIASVQVFSSGCSLRVRFNGCLITQLKGDWLAPTTYIHHVFRRFSRFSQHLVSLSAMRARSPISQTAIHFHLAVLANVGPEIKFSTRYLSPDNLDVVLNYEPGKY